MTKVRRTLKLSDQIVRKSNKILKQGINRNFEYQKTI